MEWYYYNRLSENWQVSKTKLKLNSLFMHVKGRVFKIASTSANNVANLSKYNKFSTHTLSETLLNQAIQPLIESS